jgi:hypothetical protein
MKTEILVALVAGVFSLIAAGFAVFTSIKSDKIRSAIAELQIKEKQREEAEQRQKETAYYSEPLARSAYELNNRLHNILHQYLIDVYLVGGNEREVLCSILPNIFAGPKLSEEKFNTSTLVQARARDSFSLFRLRSPELSQVDFQALSCVCSL